MWLFSLMDASLKKMWKNIHCRQDFPIDIFKK